MAKSDKEKELGLKISELEAANSGLKKSNIQLEKDVKSLTENGEKVGDVKSVLSGKETELAEALRSSGLLKDQVRSLTQKNQEMLTEKGQKSEQGDKIKTQQKEIEKLIDERDGLAKTIAKTEGEFPIFSDPNKETGRAFLVSTVQMSKNERLVVYKSDMAKGGSLVYQVIMEGSDCKSVDCRIVK